MSVQLNEICELIVDCPHSTATDEGAGYPLIRTPNIGPGYFNLEGVHRVSKAAYDKRNLRAIPRPNDLILAREAPAGNVAIIPDGAEFCLGQRTVLIRPDASKVYPLFLNYYLNAPEQRHKLLRNANGATVSHVNMPIIRNLSVDLPSVEAQKRIASILGAYDALIENNRKQIKLLEEAAQRLYKEWFIDLRFPGHETATIDPQTELPEGWSRSALGSFAHVVLGQSPKSEYYNNEQRGMPFHQGVASYGFRFVVDHTYTEHAPKIGEAGSILFSVRAPVGRINLTRSEIAIGRGLSAINHKNGLQGLLLYRLKNRFFKDNLVGNGSIYSAVSKDELLQTQFVIAPSAIEEEFDRLVAPINSKIDALDKSCIIASEARDRLLPIFMGGEIEI